MSVLLLEDHYIIALDAQAMLEKLGFEHVNVAASVSEALEIKLFLKVSNIIFQILIPIMRVCDHGFCPN